MAIPKTKTGRLALCAEIIDRYKVGEAFTPWDILTMSNLCGCVFDFIRRHDRGTPGRHIWVWLSSNRKQNEHLEMLEGRELNQESVYKGTWSWRASIVGYNMGKNVMQAMRLATKAGTFGAFVRSSECAECRATEDLTTDHKTVPFRTIAENFIAEFNNPLIKNDSDGGWSLQDPTHFMIYHDALADYQTLCRSCNSSKGAK
jgi:hypothetical protein